MSSSGCGRIIIFFFKVFQKTTNFEKSLNERSLIHILFSKIYLFFIDFGPIINFSKSNLTCFIDGSPRIKFIEIKIELSPLILSNFLIEFSKHQLLANQL